MDRRSFLKKTIAGSLAASPLMQLTGKSDRKPNIILIFSDDAGYADFGFQGSTVFKTPHLDKMAKESVQCTSAYVTAAVCGPSRAGLLTGRYQQRFGFEENNVPGYMSASSRLLGDDMGLPVDEVTLADRLKPLGYRSMILGKWHLGYADRYHPLKRGFDEFYGFRCGARDYWPYGEDFQNRHKKLERNFGQYEEAEGYLTEALASEACAFMKRSQHQPFFMYLSFNAVHTPMQAQEEDLAEFPELKGKRKTLAAMTLAMDRACGQVLDQVDKLGLRENTLVVFTNDNGGPADTNASVNDPLSGTKATHLEGGIRVPFLMRWPGKLPRGIKYHHPVSTLDLLPTFVDAAGGHSKSMEGLDGVDLLPFLSGKDKSRAHQTLYWKKEIRAAVRDGDWKLIRLPDRQAQLYDLKNDPSETTDLAMTHPDIVRELYRKLFDWELELERPLFQLQRKYERWNRERFDTFKKVKVP